MDRKTKVNGLLVSTVRLPIEAMRLCHSQIETYGGRYETCIFDDKNDCSAVVERYMTRDEARSAHKAWVSLAASGRSFEELIAAGEHLFLLD